MQDLEKAKAEAAQQEAFETEEEFDTEVCPPPPVVKLVLQAACCGILHACNASQASLQVLHSIAESDPVLVIQTRSMCKTMHETSLRRSAACDLLLV